MKATPYYDKDGITIYCGNCLEVMPGLEGVDSLISDPPYGVNFNTDYTRFSGGVAPQAIHKAVYGDDKLFDATPLLAYRRVVLWGANCYPLPQGTNLVWDKRSKGNDKSIMSDAEIAWMNSGHGVYIFHHTWDGYRRDSERGTKYHPNQKPVIVMQWIIEKAKPQGLICDPYMGSGSTLVAAQREGHRAVGIELFEEYCQAAVERLASPTFFSLPQANGSEPKPEQLVLGLELDGDE